MFTFMVSSQILFHIFHTMLLDYKRVLEQDRTCKVAGEAVQVSLSLECQNLSLIHLKRCTMHYMFHNMINRSYQYSSFLSFL